jgi:predicted nucleotidyltransferase
MKFTIKTTEIPKVYEIEDSDQYQIEFFANIEDFFAMLDSINPRHIENYIKNKTKKTFSLTNK